MLRKPVFWIGFSLFSLLCTYFAYQSFSSAFPIVNLDLKMDRSLALETARSLAEEQGFGPDEFDQAASFGVNGAVQTFVELEAGGTEAFAEMILGDLYSPFTWSVRHYREGETTETMFWFTPAGKPYGFRHALPEDQPGASLPVAEARTIAEEAATSTWGIDLTPFALVEESQELRLGGRTDHSFVYERTQEKIGEGQYRLRLTVSGDRLSGLMHFIKIPESFSRRYEEMRSFNNSIASAAALIGGILFMGGGCCFGLFVLMRARWVIWKAPLLWGGFIAFLGFLSGLNELPLMWMSYDTAVAAQGFLIDQIVRIAGSALMMGLIMTISFMAAESLTRKAFPGQLQFWKTWSAGSANTSTVLGQSLTGFLLVGIFFAYEVILYFVTTRYLDWWTPSSALFHPDSLATAMPWLSAIANSAQAGFWEECLFRAVPIAGAAVIGQRLGRRNWWIVSAVVVQALVFSGAHANYPAQPAYARLAELIIPSLAFAALYLFLGLLPAIVLHFAFDVVWFALPVFVSQAEGVWIDRLLIIGLTLVPLWVVLLTRFRTGLWADSSSSLRNSDWRPAKLERRESETPEKLEDLGQVNPLLRWIIPVLGLVGIVVWLLSSEFAPLVPPIEIGRAEALATAERAFSERGIELSSEWSTLSTVEVPINQNDRFVFREGGKEAYAQLMGTYLGPPYWIIRSTRFEGDLVERAEEYEVQVAPDGRLMRFTHQLPESREGAQLSEEEARELVEPFIEKNFGLQVSELKFISSEPRQLPNRKDWVFTFADPADYPLEEGEARISVGLSGATDLDGFRYVHVPEEWGRAERNRRTVSRIIAIVCSILLAFIMVAGAIAAVIRWSRHAFSTRAFFITLGVLFGIGVILRLNQLPSVLIRFSNAQPYNLQLAIALIGVVMGTLFLASTIALLSGMVHEWIGRNGNRSTPSQSAVIGLSLGALFAGLMTLNHRMEVQMTPEWPDLSSAAAVIPILATALSPLSGVIFQSVVLMLTVLAVRNLALRKPWAKYLPIPAFLLLALVVSGSGGPDDVVSWIIGGTVSGLILYGAYHWILRRDISVVPPLIGMMVTLSTLQQAILQAYPEALVGGIVAAFLILALSIGWMRRLSG